MGYGCRWLARHFPPPDPRFSLWRCASMCFDGCDVCRWMASHLFPPCFSCLLWLEWWEGVLQCVSTMERKTRWRCDSICFDGYGLVNKTTTRCRWLLPYHCPPLSVLDLDESCFLLPTRALSRDNACLRGINDTCRNLLALLSRHEVLWFGYWCIQHSSTLWLSIKSTFFLCFIFPVADWNSLSLLLVTKGRPSPLNVNEVMKRLQEAEASKLPWFLIHPSLTSSEQTLHYLPFLSVHLVQHWLTPVSWRWCL